MGERLITVARVLLGLTLVLFGANGLFEFLPERPAQPKQAEAFLEAVIDTGYLMELLCVTQVACGALLLVNRLVPLALVCLAPVSVNILCFQLVLAPGVLATGVLATRVWGIAGYAVFAFNVLLLIAYRRQVAPMLAYKTNPGDV